MHVAVYGYILSISAVQLVVLNGTQMRKINLQLSQSLISPCAAAITCKKAAVYAYIISMSDVKLDVLNDTGINLQLSNQIIIQATGVIMCTKIKVM